MQQRPEFFKFLSADVAGVTLSHHDIFASNGKIANTFLHWDFADEFSAHEAASLILGVDPMIESEAVRAKPIFEKLRSSYRLAWVYWHVRCDGLFKFNEEGTLSVVAIQSTEMQTIVKMFVQSEMTDESIEFFGDWVGWGTSEDGEFSGFLQQRFSRTELSRWLNVLGLKSVFQFDSKQTTKLEVIIEADIDPADLPDELQAANIAFRAVTNGYGDKTATFKNRLIDYLDKNFTALNNEAVQRIATVANPDKGRGRKKSITE